MLYIPGYGCDTHRFLLGVVERIRIGVNDLALNLVCPSTIISQTSSAQADINLGHVDRLAIVHRFNSCELVEVLVKEVSELHEILPSLLWGDFSPCPFEGLAGNGDSVVDVFLCGFVDGYDGLFGRGIDALKGLAILAFHKFVVDEAEWVMISKESFGGVVFAVRGIGLTAARRLPATTAQSSDQSELEMNGETHSPVGC